MDYTRTARWMSVFAVVLLGIGIGAGAYTLVYARGASYLLDDPQACVNCHIMREQFDGWEKSSHHAVATCNDCHVAHGPVSKWLTKAENGFHHSVAFTFQNFHEPIQIRESSSLLLQSNCVRCHADITDAITWNHPKTRDRCVRCHDSVGHGPSR
ncbi:MAG TPA: cytochrome c nitrite reductase small subunit [Candidatus Latescibacteria bacterium]|nr:cytochrome c nitrite reductase small subunit [Candidatus Latescibacterota bacterium]HQE60676.1 cytochrome c nitrite reductase small subunit [Candidatus Latescibacterota bacterium]HQI75414.1 cytochrome c nitrite reductase small subunit [Candidatus Latescibacterota bacterium]HRU23410.1 cytochrome c nitrite reductase small subunit [Candidatus Latescibacterota bacterium]